MKIQPRQQLVELWKATVNAALEDGKWVWGGRFRPNSISDAEQLMTIMYPASVIPFFKIDLPDETADDVLDALRALGNEIDIPRRMVDVIQEYIDNYTDEDGTPLFSGGSYFKGPGPGKEPTEEQAALDVVDSFSMSVSLMLYVIGFVRVFRNVVRNTELLAKLEKLESTASDRLTGAMVGLLRSFTVNVFTPESAEGQVLLRTVNQAGDKPRQVAEELRYALREVRASVRDFTIGSGQTSELDNANRLFEVGWSWGVLHDAPIVDDVPNIPGRQRAGVAEKRPFLYFTVNALDGITDLFLPRTVVLRLLNEEQQRLAQALRLRWQLTQTYWATIATFGSGVRWPLEDIPWVTTDGKQSDYYSLLVTSMAVQDLEERRASDEKLLKLGRVLQELAQRGRITRRSTGPEDGVEVHSPGTRISLNGSETLGGPKLAWQATDYAAVVLKRTLKVAGMAGSTELRDQLLEFSDALWEHLQGRKMRGGPPTGLWDQPQRVYPTVTTYFEQPSWYYTERIVECLVEATNLVTGSSGRSPVLYSMARDLLNEADFVYDYEVLNGPTSLRGALRTQLDHAHANLARAREILEEKPGTAAALAQQVLRDLDALEVARRTVGGEN